MCTQGALGVMSRFGGTLGLRRGGRPATGSIGDPTRDAGRMADAPPSFRSIRRAAAAVIGTDAVPTFELVEKLLAGGLELGSDPEDLVRDVLLDDTAFFELEGGEWI